MLKETADITPVEDGCRKGLKITRKYQNSTITQFIYLYNSIERIDDKNVIDWHEHHQLVKIAFPLNIHSNYATYDIQFGNIAINNHTNTSWDAAKFEVCAHKWGDFSEYGYGVSLLNDCKYGYSMEDNILKLTAIKCGTYPNGEADQGLHEFTYSIYPHTGDFRDGDTVRTAYSLNQPLEAMKVSHNSNAEYPENFSFVKCDCENIIVDTVKQCEDDNGIIIRLFDAFNTKSTAKLTFGLPVVKAEICDMLENIIDESDVIDNTITLSISNYEIITLKISF